MNIGLIAHDAKKTLLQNLCIAYRSVLAKHTLYATGTSGRLVEEATGLNVRKYLAGHVGGVQQMGSQIEQNDLDLVIFLRDPEQPKQHEPDVHRIIRLCDVHSIPLATNLATAEMLIKSLDRGEMDWRESTGETTNTTEKEQKLPVTEKNGTAPEKTEHILNRLIIGVGVCVAVIAVLIGVKLYRQDRQMDITEPFARSMVLASDPLSAEKRFQAETLSADLCVGETSVPLNDISFSSQVKAGLFDLDHKKVLFAQNMYDQVYPASITKIMTALLAMEYNQPDTQVTITEEDLALEDGSQMSGLAVGDTVTMDQLFHALLIYSANDAAMAIARQVGGSVENFVQMMNDKAASLAMTGTHFANPHGLHDENHYTTAYDVYLMLYAAYQHTEFQNTMSMSSYTLNMTHADGTAGTIYLSSTDKYLTGEKNAPENVTVLGGKTGTTDEAGSCLALVSQNAYGEPFISVILHASTKVELYEDMNTLLSNINS